jgi:hypothetical protein
MESFFRKVVWYINEPRRYPKTNAALLTVAVAGSALVLYYILRRSTSESRNHLIAMPSGLLLRQHILKRGAFLSNKLVPLQQGNSKAVLLPQGGVPVSNYNYVVKQLGIPKLALSRVIHFTRSSLLLCLMPKTSWRKRRLVS